MERLLVAPSEGTVRKPAYFATKQSCCWYGLRASRVADVLCPRASGVAAFDIHSAKLLPFGSCARSSDRRVNSPLALRHPTRERRSRAGEETRMLWTIFAILLLLWVLGWGFHIAGSLIHLILVIAVVVLLIELITGRRAAI
jgi:uncharacterized protein DUF5670